MATIVRTSDQERDAMQRSALGRTQGPTEQERIGGNGPSASWFGRDFDPQDPTRVGFPFLRRMRRDHMMAMGLHFIAMPIVKSSWYFEADDARVASFADNLIRPIFGSLMLTLLRVLWAGYSPAVKNFDFVIPNWVYYIDGEPKKVWDNGDIKATIYKPVIGLRPEAAVPVFKDGAFNGITYDAMFRRAGAFQINGQSTPDIDLLHSIWAVNDQEGEDGSPYGFPRIAHAAPIFHMYRYIWTLLGRAFENSADPGPIMRFPMEDVGFVDDATRAKINNAARALKIGRSRRSGSTIALPSEPYVDFNDRPTGKYKWDIEYPSFDVNFESIQSFLGYLESLKLNGLFIQEGGMTSSSGGAQSNRNVVSELGDQRDASQAVLMQQLTDLIVDVMVRPAIAINFPQYEGKIEMKTLGFGQDDEDIVRQIFQLAGQDDLSSFGIDVYRLAESRGLPMISPEEMKIRQEKAAEVAKQMQTPVVDPETPGVDPVTGQIKKPTQGRRAMVTQTGFGETAYHQLHDPINLSTDGDYVAGLPKTDVFSDQRVLSASRSLRNDSHRYLTSLYQDFAIFLGKQKIDLADELSAMTLDEEMLDDEGRIKRVVDGLMKKWKPNASKLSTFSTNSRATLARIFERTVGQQLSKIGSKNKLSATDKLAAEFLDDQGADLVRNITETTRSQLAEVLANGVREGKDVKSIADDIRSHFSDFPATRAAMIARSETTTAYNFATVSAGRAAGIKQAQLVDGNDDAPCKARNGKIVTMAQALKEKLAHPNCTLTIRLLPRATSAFSIRMEELEDGVSARYDQDTDTVLFAPTLSADDRSKYLIGLGDDLAQPLLDRELVEV
jgi:hypothetical protein